MSWSITAFSTKSELRKLKTAQAFLWKIRFALHVLTNRREDRLLFDHQIRLAKMFGYEDATYTLAVEQFMQRYYRTAMDVSLLNEMLLQLFREAILTDPNVAPVPVNAALPDPQRLPRDHQRGRVRSLSVGAAGAVRRSSNSTRKSAACAPRRSGS